MLSTASTPDHAAVVELAAKVTAKVTASSHQARRSIPIPGDSQDDPLARLSPYLKPDSQIQWDPLGVAIAPTPIFSSGMLANAYFFGHPRWGRQYAERAHRNAAFRDRWQAALERHGSDGLNGQGLSHQGLSHQGLSHQSLNNQVLNSQGWDDKVVIDLGCGAGTLWERLGGEPAEIIGVDISLGALHWAAADGYAALRADAHQLPLQSECADIVCANALLHHCDRPAQVLREAARLVKPGGLLITDMDPQRSAWQRKGWGLWLNQQTWPSLMDWLRDELPQPDEQVWQGATELHNRQPGQGLQAALFQSTLSEMGFEVHLYPHHSNHHSGTGAEVFQGQWGKASLKTRWEQRLSGSGPDSASNAACLMCVAQRPPADPVPPNNAAMEERSRFLGLVPSSLQAPDRN